MNSAGPTNNEAEGTYSENRKEGDPNQKNRDTAFFDNKRIPKNKGFIDFLAATEDEWLPHVRKLRPHMAWDDVVDVINSSLSQDRKWSNARLQRAVRAYVWKRFLPQSVIGQVRRTKPDVRLPSIVANIKNADADLSLRNICDRLEAMDIKTPRGLSKWKPSMVSKLLEHAKKLGLLEVSDRDAGND